MSKKTLALIVGLILLTIALLVVALQPMIRPTPQEQVETKPGEPTVTPTPPAYTTLNISPDTYTLPSNGSGSVDVVVDTAQNELTAFQLEIGYDPKVLTNVQVVPGEFFPNPLSLLNTVDEANGRLNFALGITPAQTPVSGKGVVAKVTFQRVPGSPAGQTTIELLQKTQVTQQGVGPSVLKEAKGATVIIGTQTQPATSPTVSVTTPVPTQ